MKIVARTSWRTSLSTTKLTPLLRVRTSRIMRRLASRKSSDTGRVSDRRAVPSSPCFASSSSWRRSACRAALFGLSLSASATVSIARSRMPLASSSRAPLSAACWRRSRAISSSMFFARVSSASMANARWRISSASLSLPPARAASAAVIRRPKIACCASSWPERSATLSG